MICDITVVFGHILWYNSCIWTWFVI